VTPQEIESLAARLGTVQGGPIPAQEWKDFLVGTPEQQERWLKVKALAATPPTPDYLNDVLTIITAVAGISASVVSIVSGVQAIREIIKTL
jgi:hypothetical protein